MKKKQEKGFGIRLQLLIMTIMPAMLIAVALMLSANYSLSSGLTNEALTGLSLLAQSVKGSYENMDGDFLLDGNDQLWKGDVNLSENPDLIDAYVEGTDADVTIFIDKTRRLTTLVDVTTGERIVGTDASDAVWAAVQNGETYEATDLTINNLPYTACYLPLENSQGEIIGMVFAGQPSTGVDSFIKQKLNTFILISVMLLVGAAFYGFCSSTRLSGSILKAENAIRHLRADNLM